MSNENKQSISVSYNRTNSVPLDDTSIFESLSAAQEYVSATDSTSYIGQFITVKENDKAVGYILQPSGELGKIASDEDSVSFDTLPIEESLKTRHDASIVQKVGVKDSNEPNISTADSAVVFGKGNTSNASYNFTIGRNNTNGCIDSILFGELCSTDGLGTGSLCGGSECQVTNRYGAAIGNNVKVHGYYGFGHGLNIVINSDGASGMGADIEVNGTHSCAVGKLTSIEAINAFSSGAYNHIGPNARGSAVHGEHLSSYYPNQLVTGYYNANKPDTAFEVGNGTNPGGINAKPLNVFEIYKDGHAQVSRSTTDEDADNTLVTKDYLLNKIHKLEQALGSYITDIDALLGGE